MLCKKFLELLYSLTKFSCDKTVPNKCKLLAMHFLKVRSGFSKLPFEMTIFKKDFKFFKAIYLKRVRFGKEKVKVKSSKKK